MFEVLLIGRDSEKAVASFDSLPLAMADALKRWTPRMVVVVREASTDKRWSYNEMRAAQ